jgi:hypothetical protein
VAAANVGLVDDVVVHEARRVDHFNDLREHPVLRPRGRHHHTRLALFGTPVRETNSSMKERESLYSGIKKIIELKKRKRVYRGRGRDSAMRARGAV